MRRALPDLRVSLAAGLATGAAAFAYYLTLPGRSVSSLVQEVTALAGTRTLTSDQQKMVGIISAEFGRAGLSWLVVPAVVNAYAESRLNPVAEGDNGYAIGLFQLNSASKSAAGYGMTVEQRQDPETNTRKIIAVVQSSDGSAIRAARGATNAKLTRLFAQWAERCSKCGWKGGSDELDEREQLTYELYGDDIARRVP